VLVLAIETATDVAAVAVADDGGVRAALVVGRARRHAETVVPAVADVCSHAGIALGDVDAVAVDVGPGLFTGLRVGVGAANAFSFALGVPVVGVGSLDVLAAAAAQTCRAGALVAAVVDARRGEVFWALYRVEIEDPVSTDRSDRGVRADSVRRIGAERVSDAATLASTLAAEAEPVLAVGDGARRYAHVLTGAPPPATPASEDDAGRPRVVVAGPMFAHPPVGILAALAVCRAASGVDVAEGPVLPRYLRDADARINWETRRHPAPARESA